MSLGSAWLAGWLTGWLAGWLFAYKMNTDNSKSSGKEQNEYYFYANWQGKTLKWIATKENLIFQNYYHSNAFIHILDFKMFASWMYTRTPIAASDCTYSSLNTTQNYNNCVNLSLSSQQPAHPLPHWCHINGNSISLQGHHHLSTLRKVGLEDGSGVVGGRG